jgi:hypothetical protein
VSRKVFHTLLYGEAFACFLSGEKGCCLLNRQLECTHSQGRKAPERYRVLFLNRDRESKEVRRLMSQRRIKIKRIEVEDQRDVPRLVTAERIFVGCRSIKDYLDNWSKVEKIIVT